MWLAIVGFCQIYYSLLIHSFSSLRKSMKSLKALIPHTPQTLSYFDLPSQIELHLSIK